MAIKESQNPLAGAKGISEEEKCQICKTTRDNGVPYDEFFTPEEREQLDKIAQANPELVPMLPPKDAKYLPTKNPAATAARREQWHKKKTKSGVEGEYHHPHPIGAGGCPFHQKVVKKPDDPAEKAKVDALDKQIKDIVDGAITRARGT